jgi:hypothetical protein
MSWSASSRSGSGSTLTGSREYDDFDRGCLGNGGLGDHSGGDVSIGDDPDEPLTLGYGKRADVLVSHSLRGLEIERAALEGRQRRRLDLRCVETGRGPSESGRAVGAFGQVSSWIISATRWRVTPRALPMAV